MKKVLFLLVTIFAIEAKVNKPESEDAIKKVAVEKEDKICTLIYMNGCGHCERVKPLIEDLSKEFNNVVFFEIEVSKAPELANSEKAKGFPHIVYFKETDAVPSDRTEGANIQEIKNKVATLAKN